MIYEVLALINFTDYLGKEIKEDNEHYERKANESIWKCTKERAEYLISKGAVKLIKIENVENVDKVVDKPKRTRKKKE